MRGVFLVCLSGGPIEELADLLRARYPEPDHYQLSKRAFLVRADSISDWVADSIGIKSDDRIEGATGVVFRLRGSYAGFFERSVWEWLDLEALR